MRTATPWIHSRWLDMPFILAPPFVTLLLVLLFPQWFGPDAMLTEVHWLVLVLLIDVAHVYSTIYRTYLDKEAVRHYRFQLVWLPLFAFVTMVLLHSSSREWFWRCMAYLAVFHFVRQQYGFMRLYARKDLVPPWKRHLDGVAIYAATLAPMLYWHFSYPRRFDWFVEGDLVGANVPALANGVLVLHAIVLVLYGVSELLLFARGGTFNLPKNVLVIGTAISWAMGIIWYNGDVTFTLFNVVGHGVPYMALVWAYGRRKRERATEPGRLARVFFSLRAVPVYLLILFLLAFFEEGLWNSMVWHEHASIFGLFSGLPALDGHIVLSFLVPLLSLPQVTHYIIDAFIWRMRPEKDKDGWQQVIFGRMR